MSVPEYSYSFKKITAERWRAVTDKVKNNFADEVSLSHFCCRPKKKLATAAALWQILREQAKVLAAMMIRTTERIFENGALANVVRVQVVSNLELIFNLHLTVKLEESTRSEAVKIEQVRKKLWRCRENWLTRNGSNCRAENR